MYDLGGVLLNRKGIIPIFVVILTILTILISIGYSALNQNLSVSGEAFLRAKDNIRISRIELSDAANDGYETYNPEYSKRTTKMYTTLPKDDSSVTYTVKVTNSTGIRYKVGSIDVTSTNSNVSCTPSIEVNTILEDGITEFTVTANYENGMSQDTNLNACDIKYEFVPLDATPPTLAVQLVSDNGNTKTIKITAIDEAEGSGLSPDNIYKYYLSTSETELLGGIWKEYVNSTEFEISGDIEARYLWIYPVRDRAGNISGGNSSVEPYSVGKYIFIDDVPTLYNVIAKEALTDGVAKLYTGKHNDAYDESGTENIYYFYGADDASAMSVLNKNNVLFAGFCWQMIRTTDTGGTKLIYNGLPKEVDGKKVCTNSGTEQQIGASAFNEEIDSPSYVGYMYNEVYHSKKHSANRENVWYGGLSLNTTNWYADSIIYENGNYSLVNPYQVSSSEFANMKGKYTFNNSNKSYINSVIYYIGEVKNNDYYTITLTGGNDIDYYNDIYAYGTSYIKNEDGTYTIDNPTYSSRLEYYSDYANFKGKYLCKNSDNGICDNLLYISYSDDAGFYWLDLDNEYKFSKGFSYSNGKYILNDESVMIWNTSSTEEQQKISNAHYTCFNSNGECEILSYVYSIYGNNTTIYYVELQDGIGIDGALEKMLTADNVNQTSSTIKNTIDNWYQENMTSYTNYLEDTVFCNDRSIYDYGGWNPNGGLVNGSIEYWLKFKQYNFTSDLYCTNVTDRFSVGNDKAKLTYPVGLMSTSEMNLLGNDNVRSTGTSYWNFSAGYFSDHSRMSYVTTTGGSKNYSNASYDFAVRPSVSLVPNTRYAAGTGSTTDPYIVDISAPTLTQETLIDGEREKTVRITISDDYGLSSENKYQYYLSTSATTLSGGEWKDYISGEMFILAGENETKYLWVYPVMDSAWNINDSKSDVNTPYVLSTIIFKNKQTLYNVLRGESASGSGLAKLYEGEHNDAYDETGTQNIYHFYGADDTTATSILNKNNVLFGGFCWQMIRTTDTGGTKLIYNGVPKEQDGKKVCTNSGEEQQIGTSAFNETSTSPAHVGYMYNNVYEYKQKNMYATESVFASSTYRNFLNKNYYYAYSVTYDSSTREYTLVNPTTIGTSGSITSASNKYTIKKYGKSNTSVYYIAGVSGTTGGSGTVNYTYYYVFLTGGKTLDSYSKVYSYGTSYTKNSDGTYTLNNATYMPLKSYKNSHSNLNGKYVCKNAVNNVCTNIWYVVSSKPYTFDYLSSENEYKYAKSFTYENGKYTLNNESAMVWDLGNSSEQEKLNNYHYTCFNASGECETVYYIYYKTDDNKSLYYIELNNGVSIEEALQSMLSSDDVNKTNSTIKDTIDTWYTNNMTGYTEYLEDAVFCNDRSISNHNGWNPNGGSISSYLLFKNFNVTNNDLYCTNITDRFSVGNEKARLTYKVGLMSAPEMNLLGNNSIRKTGQWYWLSSPYHFNSTTTAARFVYTDGNIDNSYGGVAVGGVRPSISVAPTVEYLSGTGSKTDPYLIP